MTKAFNEAALARAAQGQLTNLRQSRKGGIESMSDLEPIRLEPIRSTVQVSLVEGVGREGPPPPRVRRLLHWLLKTAMGALVKEVVEAFVELGKGVPGLFRSRRGVT